jgi:hypothetical protein
MQRHENRALGGELLINRADADARDLGRVTGSNALW